MSSSIKTEKPGAAFTPGPWSVFGIDGPKPGVEAPDIPFSIIVVGFPDEDNDEAGVHGRTSDEVRANARLIAAAPKLYEALRAAENEIHFPGSNKAEGIDIAALIREVLEEVEGES